MKHTIKELENCRIQIDVDVESDVWEEAQRKEFQRALGSVQIKGFRRGKAPAAMAAPYVNQEKVANAALNSVANLVYAQVLSEAHIQPYARPEVSPEFKEGKLHLTYVVITMPKVTLGQYTGIEAKREPVSVTEEEIAESINNRLKNAAELEVVEREAKLGDTITLDFKGFIDGKAFDGGEAENYALELGSNSFVPGFEDALVGTKAGDDKDVDIVFPTQYVEELAGKPATFKCHIHEVKEKKVPALDDEAVKDLAINEVKTVEELKAFERKSILERKMGQSNEAYYMAIVNQVVANATVIFPPEILDSEVENQIENTKKQVESNGLTFEQYLQITGQTLETLQAATRVQSEASLKQFLVLNAIEYKEHMIVDDNELNIELSRLADQYKMKVDEVKKALGNQIEGFRSNIQQRKIRDYLLANNGEAVKTEKKEEAAEEKPAKKPTAKKPAAKKEGTEAKKPAAKKTSSKKAE